MSYDDIEFLLPFWEGAKAGCLRRRDIASQEKVRLSLFGKKKRLKDIIAEDEIRCGGLVFTEETFSKKHDTLWGSIKYAVVAQLFDVKRCFEFRELSKKTDALSERISALLATKETFSENKLSTSPFYFINKARTYSWHGKAIDLVEDLWGRWKNMWRRAR